MASIEERIAFRQTQEMDEDRLRAFLKAVPNEILLDELRRRITITAEVKDMATFVHRAIASNE